MKSASIKEINKIDNKQIIFSYMNDNEKSLMKGFEEFINEHLDAIFEASTLSAIPGLPKEMISAIHQKAEQKQEDFPNIGFVYRSENPLVLPYKNVTPSHKIEVGAPTIFTGKKMPVPEGALRKSVYTDFAEYLIGLPRGPLHVLITRPEEEFYMYLYYKSIRQGGEQYAILIWDKNKGNAVDFAYVGLTVEGVDKQLVREVHRTKGGNTNQKVQEIVRSLAGGPTPNAPVSIYELTQAEMEKPADVRRERKALKNYGTYPIPSLNVIELFANKYLNTLAKKDSKFGAGLLTSIRRYSKNVSNMPAMPNVKEFAENLGVPQESVFSGLYLAFVDFRAKLYEKGRLDSPEAPSAYNRTDGFELYTENKFANSVGMARKDTSKYARIAYNAPYKFGSLYDPTDPRKTEDEKKALMRAKGQRVPYHLPPENLRRTIPDKGNYASIDSMIKHHTLDGLLHRFAWFMATGKITAPAVNFLHALGIDVDSDSGDLDIENLVL